MHDGAGDRRQRSRFRHYSHVTDDRAERALTGRVRHLQPDTPCAHRPPSIRRAPSGRLGAHGARSGEHPAVRTAAGARVVAVPPACRSARHNRRGAHRHWLRDRRGGRPGCEEPRAEQRREHRWVYEQAHGVMGPRHCSVEPGRASRRHAGARVDGPSPRWAGGRRCAFGMPRLRISDSVVRRRRRPHRLPSWLLGSEAARQHRARRRERLHGACGRAPTTAA